MGGGILDLGSDQSVVSSLSHIMMFGANTSWWSHFGYGYSRLNKC